jgi:hypothetical protein
VTPASAPRPRALSPSRHVQDVREISGVTFCASPVNALLRLRRHAQEAGNQLGPIRPPLWRACSGPAPSSRLQQPRRSKGGTPEPRRPANCGPPAQKRRESPLTRSNSSGNEIPHQLEPPSVSADYWGAAPGRRSTSPRPAGTFLSDSPDPIRVAPDGYRGLGRSGEDLVRHVSFLPLREHVVHDHAI